MPKNIKHFALITNTYAPETSEFKLASAILRFYAVQDRVEQQKENYFKDDGTLSYQSPLEMRFDKIDISFFNLVSNSLKQLVP